MPDAPRWTAADVKAKLRGRHPATQRMGSRIIPGPWTCIEELLGCDLLAVGATRCPINGPLGVQFPRVGYEVKVSRGDYRTELRHPYKRADAVAGTHAFYFAVPDGLLTAEELTRRQPAGDDALTLWVPQDVGLVIVSGRGVRVTFQSPVRRDPRHVDQADLGGLVRFVSSHPDPRHDGVVAADRAYCVRLREQARAREAQRAADVERWNEEMRRIDRREDAA